MNKLNKKKIINDPIYGFINIPNDLIFDIIEHKYFQRLRNIKQLGLTYLVYPSAVHTRFQHALGCMHLVSLAIEVLKSKDIEITDEEAQGVTIAAMLHDIGHGPFSHCLENNIINIKHESLSEKYMEELNRVFGGALLLAIRIYNNSYEKLFLHQLVSGQLDVDRLDYLKRDSFFTGVSEGVIGTDRIIKMLNVVNNNLVVELKGIYSIEKFIISRRLMFWQVYLHKAVLSAQYMLSQSIKRAKYLYKKGEKIFLTEYLRYFFENDDYVIDSNLLELFSNLDDNDFYICLKYWSMERDIILSNLSKGILDRRLYRLELQNEPFSEDYVYDIREKIKNTYNVNEEDIKYIVFSGEVENSIYNPYMDKINILMKDNKVVDISEASDQLNLSVLSKMIKKYYLCYPK